jgi:hypothetical protein
MEATVLSRHREYLLLHNIKLVLGWWSTSSNDGIGINDTIGGGIMGLIFVHTSDLANASGIAIGQ